MDLSIGALATATGVPATTLRTWERRYGFPVAHRTLGGQRLYAPESVERVRLVARAIDLGHRPAQLVTAGLDELRLLSDVPARATPVAAPPAVSPRSTAPPSAVAGPEVEAWVRCAAALDGDGLDRGFRSCLASMGLQTFVAACAGPFLLALGEAWASGRIQPFHEHFASERLRELLVASWRPLSESNAGPIAVLATMPSERHGLGLHMAACLIAEAGWRVLFLGVETPLPDIDSCVRQAGARAVVVSVSAASNPAQATWDLASLRARLPGDVRLLAGGAGAGLAESDDGPWHRLAGLRELLATPTTRS